MSVENQPKKFDTHSARLRSVRSHRRLAERIMREAYRGERTFKEAKDAIDGISKMTEMFLTEKQLARVGEDHEDPHPEGVDGGLPNEQPGRPQIQRTQYREGVDPKTGEPYHEKTTSTEETGEAAIPIRTIPVDNGRQGETAPPKITENGEPDDD